MNPFVINKTPLTATMGVKPNDVSLIQLRPALGGADAPRLPCGGVRRALLLRLLEGALLAQESLAFVSLACPTPLQDHRGEPGMPAGATRQSRVTCREEQEVVQVCVAEAKGPPRAHEHDPGAMPEILAALIAPAVSAVDEDPEVAAGFRLHVARDYAARGEISASIFPPESFAAVFRSKAVCRSVQNSGLVPKYREGSNAVSGVTARRSRTMSLMRGAGTLSSGARALAESPSGTRNSSRRISPVWMGRILLMVAVLNGNRRTPRVGVSVFEMNTQAPLIIYPNANLLSIVALRGLQSVRRGYAQVADAPRDVEHLKLPLRDRLKSPEAIRRLSEV